MFGILVLQFLVIYRLIYMLIAHISDKVLSDHIGHENVLDRLYSLVQFNVNHPHTTHNMALHFQCLDE